LVAGAEFASAKARILGEARACEHIGCGCADAELLHEYVQLAIVYPPVPAAHGERVERPHVVLPLLALLANPPVVRIIARVRVDRAREEEGLAVRPPRRESRAGIDRRDPACLDASRLIDYVHLVDLVVVALRNEREPRRQAPCGTALPAFVDVSRRGSAAVRRYLHRSDR
jgi:hypothetical protein